MTRPSQNHLAALLGVLLTLAACGPGAPPSQGKAPGSTCAKTSECQGGLECASDGVCRYARCEDAPDPLAFCAREKNTTADRVACAAGVCEVVLGEPGDACAEDAGCRFGLICEGVDKKTCVETCVSSASCRTAGEVCLPRQSDPAASAKKHCQPDPGCTTQTAPEAHCADQLGVAPEEAICQRDGTCAFRTHAEGEPCRLDGQCAGALVCEDDLCAALCDGTCASAEDTCLPRPSGREGSICRPQTCDDMVNGHDWCAEQHGAGWYCDQGECLDGGIPSGTLLVYMLDTSMSDACALTVHGAGAPGVALTHAVLRDAGGEVIGYAATLGTLNGSSSTVENGYQDTDHLIGEAPELDAQRCPVAVDGARFRTDTVTALGCSGVAILGFLDEVGEPIVLQAGMELELGTFHDLCASPEEPRSMNATYALGTCSDLERVASGDLSSCDTRIGSDLTGITTVTLTAELLSAPPR